MPLGKKCLRTGLRTGCHYLISLSVCVTFVVFTDDCESCTRQISTNPGSMEASECGRMRGTCFITRRLEVVAVAGLLLISWCVLGGADFFVCFFSIFFFFERTRPAASTRPPSLIYLSTSTGERTGCHYLTLNGYGQHRPCKIVLLTLVTPRGGSPTYIFNEE